MYYSAVGLLAIAVLLIVNHDLLLNRFRNGRKPAWKVYRRFLFTVLIYYVTDVLWGTLESRKLALPLFADTTIYFIAMAAGVLFWTQYIIVYLEDRTLFGRVLVWAGRLIAGAISGLALLNIFVPVLFTVDSSCVYRALPVRYVLLSSQILLLLLISSFAIASLVRQGPEKRHKNLALAFFGLIVGTFLFIQLWFPYLPLYTVAYMLGTCLLHTFVISEEKEDYRKKLEAAYEQQRRAGTVSAHIAMSLARGYTDLFYVNMETDEYIEYQTEDGGSHLVEARRGHDFFESCKREVKLYVHPDDNEAFVKAMDRRFLEEALSGNRVFEMAYRRIKGGDPFYVLMQVSRMEDDDRFIVIGVRNIDEQVRQRHAQELLREEQQTYNRIYALTGGFIAMYLVDPDTGHYREFGSSDGYEERFNRLAEGENFFESARESCRVHSHPEDVDLFLAVFTKENVLAEIERRGIFTLGYRLMMDGKPVHVQLKAAMVEEDEGRLVIGINDVDAQVRQEKEYRSSLEQAQKQAAIDALTGLKNKHAYLEAEAQLNQRIAGHTQPPFAVVMLDVNDLKKINDTRGHQAGDRCLRDAGKMICDTFSHSPVFRIGGDEFAVISQGRDYDCIDELVGKIRDYNEKASHTDDVRIACGMARFGDDACVASVFERADHNMYENKKALKSRE